MTQERKKRKITPLGVITGASRPGGSPRLIDNATPDQYSTGQVLDQCPYPAPTSLPPLTQARMENSLSTGSAPARVVLQRACGHHLQVRAALLASMPSDAQAGPSRGRQPQSATITCHLNSFPLGTMYDCGNHLERKTQCCSQLH